MTRRILGTAVLLLAVVSGWYLSASLRSRFVTGTDGEAGDRQRLAQTTIRTVGRSENATLAVRRQAGLQATPIAGVVTYQGQPQVGATIEISSWDGQSLKRLRSDSDGSFDAGVLPAARFRIGAAKRGKVSYSQVLDLRVPEVRESADKLRIKLRDCLLRVSGTVHDVSGGVVSGASITAYGAVAVSADYAGVFELCAPRERDLLRVSAAGYATELVRISSLEDVVTVFLSPEAVVEGVVLRRDNLSPVPNAIVSALWDTQAQTTLSDQSGRFTLVGLKPGRLDVTAAAPGLVTRSASAYHARVDGSEPIEVLLDSAVRVDGTVLREGRPVSGAWVDAQVELSTFTAITQGHGQFVLEVPTGQRSFSVRGFQMASSVDVQVDVGESQRVVLHVLDMPSISGVVLFRGDPLGGVNVVARNAGQGIRRSAETDHDGRFELVGLGDGEFVVEAGSTGLGIARRSVQLASPDMHKTIELVLQDGATISGRVLTPAGFPVANVVVRFLRNDGRDFGAGRTDEAGYFRALAMVGGGIYQSSVRASAFSFADFPAGAPNGLPTVELTTEGSSVEGLEIIIDDQVSDVSGTVLWPDNTRVPDARIEVPAARNAYPRYVPVATTDASGEFRIRGVPRSPITLRATAHGAVSALVMLNAHERRAELVLRAKSRR